jgi:hypothetical protein
LLSLTFELAEDDSKKFEECFRQFGLFMAISGFGDGSTGSARNVMEFESSKTKA